MKEKEQISKGLLNLYNKNFPNWNSAKYIFVTSSSVSISYTSESILYDFNSKVIPIEDYSIFRIDDNIQDLIIGLIKETNKIYKANKVVIYFEDNMEKEFIVEWDQSIQDEFEQYLPKSKKGKIRAWYLPVDNISPEVKPQISFTRQQFEILFSKLPESEEALVNLSHLSINEVFSLTKIYTDGSSNPLWDGSILILKKKGLEDYSAELIAHYAETEEDIERGYASAEQQPIPIVTQRMKSIYDALQLKTNATNPSITWDTVFIALYKKGLIEANYELNDDEVDLDV